MTYALDTDSNLSLADDLKVKTWALHGEAETTGVVADIVRQRVSLADYLSFTQNLREIYQALESNTEWLKHFPELQDYLTPAVYRHPQLEHDNRQLLASNARMSPAKIHAVTRDYCAHIKQSQSHSPPAMLAHIYVRYLGDLNGGQVLKRLLKSALGLSDDELSFYTFPNIQNLPQFRLKFRQAINRITVTEAERETVKQAALTVFQFNIALSTACQSKRS